MLGLILVKRVTLANSLPLGVLFEFDIFFGLALRVSQVCVPPLLFGFWEVLLEHIVGGPSF